jgi:hypothetical protein
VKFLFCLRKRSMRGHDIIVIGPEDQEAQDPAEVGTAALETGGLPGPPTALTCPECGGALWELISGDRLAERTRKRGLDRLAQRYESTAEHAQRGSTGVLLLSGIVKPPPGSDGRSEEGTADLAVATPSQERT